MNYYRKENIETGYKCAVCGRKLYTDDIIAHIPNKETGKHEKKCIQCAVTDGDLEIGKEYPHYFLNN